MSKRKKPTNIFESSKEEIEAISKGIISRTAKTPVGPKEAARDLPKELPVVESAPKENKPKVGVKKTSATPKKKRGRPKKTTTKAESEKDKLKVFWIGEEAHRLAKVKASLLNMTIRDYIEGLIQTDDRVNIKL